jgi:CheY-like chemotaxis protein
MTVLVVDDTANNVAITSQVVKRMGHRPIVARSGEEALEIFLAAPPDMILMDVMMPGMGGLEATRRIRQAAGEHWLPILMVTALSREDEILEGLRAGADDYLSKPLSLPVLQAKIQVFQRIVALQQALARQAAELATYYRQAEEERRLGAQLMEYMVNRDGLNDVALRHCIIPASHFSGDLIAAAHTPGKCHHIMLSDGMGHGLPAAMATLPQFDAFYAMTELGYGIGRIAEVMNSRMHAMMPQGRFAALTLVSINPVTGTIEVWNGGNPAPCLINASGKIVKLWKSRHVPLGLLPPEEFSAEVEVFSYDGGCQLFLWSDGLTEAENAHGEQFCAERAHANLESAESAHRFEMLLQALNDHCVGKPLDDITVLMVTLAAPGTMVQLPTQAAGVESASEGLRMSYHFEASDLKSMDVVPALFGVIEQVAAIKEHTGQVFLILSELVSNALDHGLLGMDSSLKRSSEGFATYALRRQNALRELREGFIDIDIEIVRRDHRRMLKISVRDSGPGFDPAARSSVPETGLHGRGIELVCRLSHEVEYVGTGNEVVAYCELGRSEHASCSPTAFHLCSSPAEDACFEATITERGGLEMRRGP